MTYILNDRSLTEYDGPARTVIDFPLAAGGWADTHPLLAVLGGRLSAAQMARRYAIEWVQRDDPNYLMLDFTPRLPQDWQEFDRMTLALVLPGLQPPPDRLAYLPRTARIVRPHGLGVETWDFPDVQADPTKSGGVAIGPADFEPVPPPAGWKVFATRRP